MDSDTYAPREGDLVEYRGTLKHRHGEYHIEAVAPDPEGRGYVLFNGESGQRLRDVHRLSFAKAGG